MKLNVKSVKDCKNCQRAEVYGTSENPDISCKSTDSIHYTNFMTDGRYCAAYCRGYIENTNEIKRLGNVKIETALQFMIAGKSEFILHSTKNNKDYNYRLTKKERQFKKSEDTNEEFIYFLNIKYGHDWVYAGIIWFDTQDNCFKFGKGKTGNIDATDINVRSLLHVMNKLSIGQIPQYCEVFHVGKCGKCGKKLTTPESILTGLGPSCAKMVGVPRVKINKGALT